MIVVFSLLVFALAYFMVIVTTSVGYHRAFAHGAVKLHPWARRLLASTGVWLTGIDPKAWVVMHRLHHEHSDTPLDPHSPVNVGFLGMFKAQLDGYNKVIAGLLKDDDRFTSIGRDLELSWPVKKGLWFIPYLLHVGAAVGAGFAFGWPIGVALFAGSMSHVVQGAVINSFGHAWGRRNFDLPDNSRNNHLAAFLVLGEGYQNNHHRYPSSARFSHRFPEVDFGYGVCRILDAAGVLRIQERTLMPRFVAA